MFCWPKADKRWNIIHWLKVQFKARWLVSSWPESIVQFPLKHCLMVFIIWYFNDFFPQIKRIVFLTVTRVCVCCSQGSRRAAGTGQGVGAVGRVLAGRGVLPEGEGRLQRCPDGEVLDEGNSPAQRRILLSTEGLNDLIHVFRKQEKKRFSYIYLSALFLLLLTPQSLI